MASESADPIERWTAKQRVALVGSILKGDTSVAEAARTHGLTVGEVEDLAGEVSPGGRERVVDAAEGRRRREGRADQEAETEDGGSRA